MEMVAIWIIQFARKESIKLLEWIYYQKDLPCLNRKKLLAEQAIQIAANEVREPYFNFGGRKFFNHGIKPRTKRIKITWPFHWSFCCSFNHVEYFIFGKVY